MARYLTHLTASSILAITLLSACSMVTTQIAPAATPGDSSANLPSPTIQPTATSLLVTVPTRTAQPESPTSTPTKAQAAPGATPTPQMVQIFLIGLEDAVDIFINDKPLKDVLSGK